MCDERLALVDRYHSLVLKHAERVAEFSAVATADPANESQTAQLGKKLSEIELSRQAVQEARRQLKQHTLEHGCEELSAQLE